MRLLGTIVWNRSGDLSPPSATSTVASHNEYPQREHRMWRGPVCGALVAVGVAKHIGHERGGV